MPAPAPPGRSEADRLRARAEQMAQTGSWEWEPARDRVRWTDNLHSIVGAAPDLVPTAEWVSRHVHPDDREVFDAGLAEAREFGRFPAVFDYRFVRDDGEVRHLRALQAFVQGDGEARVLVGTLQDITEWRRAERQGAIHIAVTDVLSRWEDMDTSGVDLLQCVARALEASVGILWAAHDHDLVARCVWHSRASAPEEGGGITAGSGLPNARPARTALRESEPARSDPEGNVQLVAIPALAGEDDVLGVLEFRCDPGTVTVDEALMRSLGSVGWMLGRFLASRRGELAPSVLTPREIEILQMVSQGQTMRQIAEELVISPTTVATHLKNVYKKYEVPDRASAVARALREGLIT